MKRAIFLSLALSRLAFLSNSYAEQIVGETELSGKSSVQSLKLVSQTEPTILERGPHEDKIQYTRTYLDNLGNTLVTTNSYTALSTGRNFWNSQITQWQPSN